MSSILSKTDSLDPGGQGFQSTYHLSSTDSQDSASKYTKSGHVIWPGTLWNISTYKQQIVHSKRSTQLMSLKPEPGCLHQILGTTGEGELKSNRSSWKTNTWNGTSIQPLAKGRHHAHLSLSNWGVLFWPEFWEEWNQIIFQQPCSLLRECSQLSMSPATCLSAENLQPTASLISTTRNK